MTNISIQKSKDIKYYFPISNRFSNKLLVLRLLGGNQKDIQKEINKKLIDIDHQFIKTRGRNLEQKRTYHHVPRLSLSRMLERSDRDQSQKRVSSYYQKNHEKSLIKKKKRKQNDFQGILNISQCKPITSQGVRYCKTPVTERCHSRKASNRLYNPQSYKTRPTKWTFQGWIAKSSIIDPI